MSIQSPHVSPISGAERARRAARLVEDVAVRRFRGEQVLDDALIDANPDLLPELKDQLGLLRAVERARAAAPPVPGDTELLSASIVPEDAEPPEPPLPVDAVPGYRVSREISRGGQGVVYEAIQDGTKRKVAIKVLHAGAAASAAARRRFEREVELVGQLRHANIIAIFHAGIAPDGRDFYVMDFVQGRALREWVRECRPPIDEVLALFATICDAVQYAHQRGVIHRDLKPSNILVVSEPGQPASPRILDFGLARSLLPDDREALTLTDQVLGTLPYMSPEQAAGQADAVDTRTDVYALGVVLYELLTGAYPYPVAGRLMEVLRHIAETPPTPPTTVWRRESGVTSRSRSRSVRAACPIDDEIQTLVLKALAKERERRYQSAGEMARDVHRYLCGDPIEAKRDSLWYLARKLARKHAVATIATLSIVVLLLSATSISLFFYAGANEELAQRAARDAIIERENRHLRDLARIVQRWQLGAFLLEWHGDRVEHARAMRDTLVVPDSAERRVMDFLLSPQRDFEALLQALPQRDHALAYFALGESETKAARGDAARMAYQRAAELGGDEVLRNLVAARVAEFR